MKKRLKKLIGLITAFVMVFTAFGVFPLTASAICCRKDGFDKSKYTLTGDMAKDVATIAKSQKGRTCDQFGYSGVDYGFWCDEFVADCLENAGADSSIVGHGGTVADFETIMRNKGAEPVSSPQTGDLVFFTYSHVEIVTKVSNGVVYSAGGNNGSYPGICQGEHTVSSARLYLRPNYPNKKYSLSIHYNANGGTVASDSNYYIGSNNDLYRKSDNKLMGPTWEDGYKDPNGLVNASTLKLTKSGYTFIGWSLQKSSGKIYDQNDNTVSANDLYPNITKQSGTVMLYAQWAKNTVTIHYNANGGTVASDSNYYIGSNNDLYRKSDNKLMGPTWEEGYKDENGLINASTLKLTRSGYTFLGWSLQKSGGKIYDQNDNTVSANDLYPNITKQSGTVMLYAQWGKCGHVMSESEGAGQTIPDGDYWIVNGLSTRYLVDISGDNYDTTNGTNLKMHLWNTNNWGEYDVFTVKYLNNGFYSITQRTTNMTVNVKGGSLLSGSNVHMWEKNNSTAAQWSIKKTANGYTLQARCSGYYLDVEGGKTDNCNLQVYEGNGTKSQAFSFIPYNAGQPIADGVYRIGTSCGEGVYLDAAGEPGEYKDETNIQIWDAGADNYFRFEYCKNGFYKIYDNVSGLALDVNNLSNNDYLNRDANVQLYTSKDTLGQYWAIKPAGDGFYYIISKLNGYYLDLDNGKTTNGTNIHTWSGAGNTQKWSFVTNKELSVTAPSKTIYYVGEELDTTGMIVKMTYSDGYSMDVTKNVKLSCDMLTAGTKNVTVTYEHGGLKSTANFAITVKEKEVATTTTSTTTVSITTTAPITTTTTTSTTTNVGDVNNDGFVNVSDIVLLQKWLLAVPNTTLPVWQNADLCEDGKIDVFDLCLLRRKLVNG